MSKYSNSHFSERVSEEIVEEPPEEIEEATTEEAPEELSPDKHKELVKKAFLFIAGKLDVSKETPTDLENIEGIRMAILLGHPY